MAVWWQTADPSSAIPFPAAPAARPTAMAVVAVVGVRSTLITAPTVASHPLPAMAVARAPISMPVMDLPQRAAAAVAMPAITVAMVPVAR